MPEVDPAQSLAFALHSAPGRYVVLAGAGVSRAAGVPSAWGVLRHLLRNLALAEGDDEPEDPEAWWFAKYGAPPSYDGVLDALTKSSEERRAILLGFFEPTEEERDEGIKLPTAAHRATAQLMKRSAIRIVLTTNFDLLFETALRDEGVEPTVVSTADAVGAMEPLHAQRCCIVHLHGDYLTPGMLNTQDELGVYDSRVSRLLEQVFDEYSLIVSGWSGKWDLALRQALEAAAVDRRSMYWNEPLELQEHAKRLVTAHKASQAATTADDFFVRVADALESLVAAGSRRDPLDVLTAVTTAKRQLAGDRVAIDLHDRLRAEIETVASSEAIVSGNLRGDADELSRRRHVLEADTEVLMGLVAAATYWGTEQTDAWWFDAIERYAHRRHIGGDTALVRLTRAAALLISYSAGVAAVASNRYKLVARIITEPKCEDFSAVERRPVLSVLDPEIVQLGNESSAHIFELLRPLLADMLGLGLDRFRSAWERWELLHLLFNNQSTLKWQPHIRVEGIGASEGLATPAVGLFALLKSQGPRWDKHAWPGIIPYLLSTNPDHAAETTLATFNGAFADYARRRDDGLLPPGGGMLPSNRHYPGSYDEV
jgi:hypothetical protein